MEDMIQPEYNVADLLREIEGLKEENAVLREEKNSQTKDGIETFNAVVEALRTIQPGKETARFLKDSEEKIMISSPEERTLVINARIKAAAAMIRDSPAPATMGRPTEGPDPLRYDLRNLNDRRRDAIVAYMERTGKATITTQEARHVLQTSENRKLDRKAIWRALRAARDYLGAKLDLLGGVRRLIISTPSTPSSRRPDDGGSQPFETVGGGDSSPRLRRWPVPWDGED